MSVTKTAYNHSYYYLQRAKQLAKKDGHDYDKLPQYSRTDNKHKDHYHDMAKKESVNEDPAHYAALAKADAKYRKEKCMPPARNMYDKKFSNKNKSVKKESTMTFREKLVSLYEGDRAAHYKGATKPEEYDEKQKSSKGAMDMLKTPKSVEADGMKAAKDTAANIA